MNVFEFALQMEEDGKSYYEKLASESPVNELKNLFMILAAAEQNHLEVIRSMRDGVDVAVESLALDDAKNVFQHLLSMKETHGTLTFDRDGYLHANRAEEASINFYENAAAAEADEQTRSLFLFLAAEERKHLEVVENIYDYVQKPRTFLEWREFSNLSRL